jgi:hypothetical protein
MLNRYQIQACDSGNEPTEWWRVYLDEANVLGVAAEALPAAHQPVLPDQAMRVAADTAENNKNPNHKASQHENSSSKIQGT